MRGEWNGGGGFLQGRESRCKGAGVGRVKILNIAGGFMQKAVKKGLSDGIKLKWVGRATS